jgi:penicillin-insensitive murein endopeptidase
LPRFALLILFLLSSAVCAQDDSVCYGTTANGKLDNGWKLPGSGPNFSTHWTVGRIAGRSYVHSSVHPVVLDAYAAVAQSLPDKVFVYGETGWKKGGQFKPHKTHRNGLSVDFMVPVLDSNKQSVKLPSSVLNKWGYDLEFDAAGKTSKLAIDFEAMAEHIYQLHKAASKHDIKIWRVIFDPKLQPYLHASSRWPYLEEHVQFSSKPSWVRHDEHYHVDFDVPCRPL